MQNIQTYVYNDCAVFGSDPLVTLGLFGFVRDGHPLLVVLGPLLLGTMCLPWAGDRHEILPNAASWYRRKCSERLFVETHTSKFRHYQRKQ